MADELGRRGFWILADDKEVALAHMTEDQLGVAIRALGAWIRDQKIEARRIAKEKKIPVGRIRCPEIEVAEDKMTELTKERYERARAVRKKKQEELRL